MALALVLALLGNLAQVDDVVILAMVVWVGGMIVTVFGVRAGFSFWAPVASLLLMLPLPGFVSSPFVGFLERSAVGIGTAVARVGGASPTIDGQVIAFGAYQARIGELTSTLDHLFLVILLALVFATFRRGRFRMRLMPLILAAPVVVFLTGLRLGIFGVLASGPETTAARRFLALTDGWIFVATCVAVIASGVALIGLVHARRHPGEALGQTEARRAVGFHDFFATSIPRSMAAVALMSAALSTAFVLAPSKAMPEIAREPFHRFPPEIDGWVGSSTAIKRSTELILDADDYINIDFSNRAERAPVNLWSAYYHEQTREAGAIHSPEVCLPGGGWNIVSSGLATLGGDGEAGPELEVNRHGDREGRDEAARVLLVRRSRTTRRERVRRPHPREIRPDRQRTHGRGSRPVRDPGAARRGGDRCGSAVAAFGDPGSAAPSTPRSGVMSSMSNRKRCRILGPLSPGGVRPDACADASGRTGDAGKGRGRVTGITRHPSSAGAVL